MLSKLFPGWFDNENKKKKERKRPDPYRHLTFESLNAEGPRIMTDAALASNICSEQWNTAQEVGSALAGGNSTGATSESGRTAIALDGKQPSLDTPISSTAVSSNGEFFATGTREIKIMRTSNGEPVRTLTGHAGPVMGMAFLENNELLSVSYYGTVRLENIVTGALIREWGTGGISNDLHVMGRKAVIDVAERASKIIDLETGKMTDFTAGRYQRFVPVTDYIVYADETGMELWREHLTKGGRVKLTDVPNEIYNIAVSANGESVAVVGRAGMVTHVNLKDGTITPVSTTGSSGYGVMFHHEKLVTTNVTGRLSVREIQSGIATLVEERLIGPNAGTPKAIPGTKEIVTPTMSDPSNSRLAVTSLQSADPIGNGITDAALGGATNAEDILAAIAGNPDLSGTRRAAKTDVVFAQIHLCETRIDLQEADSNVQTQMSEHAQSLSAYEVAKAKVPLAQERATSEGLKLRAMQDSLKVLQDEVAALNRREPTLLKELKTLTTTLASDTAALPAAATKLKSAETAYNLAKGKPTEAEAKRNLDTARAQYDTINLRITVGKQRKTAIEKDLKDITDRRAFDLKAIDALMLSIPAQQKIYNTAVVNVAAAQKLWSTQEPLLVAAIDREKQDVEESVTEHAETLDNFDDAITELASSVITADQVERAEAILPKVVVTREGDIRSMVLGIRFSSPLESSRVVVRAGGRIIATEPFWHPVGMKDNYIQVDIGRQTEGTIGGSLEITLYDGDSSDDIIANVRGSYNRAVAPHIVLPAQPAFNEDVMGLREQEPIKPTMKILAIQGATMNLGITSPYNRSYMEIDDDSNIFANTAFEHQTGTRGKTTPLTFDIKRPSGDYFIRLYDFRGGMKIGEIPIKWSKETGKLTPTRPEDAPTVNQNFLPESIARRTLSIQKMQEFTLYEISRFNVGNTDPIVQAHRPELFLPTSDVRTRNVALEAARDGAQLYGELVGSLLNVSINQLILFADGKLWQRDMETAIDNAILGHLRHPEIYRLGEAYVTLPKREELMKEAVNIYQNQLDVLGRFETADKQEIDRQIVMAMRDDHIEINEKGEYVVVKPQNDESMQRVSRVQKLNEDRWAKMGVFPELYVASADALLKFDSNYIEPSILIAQADYPQEQPSSKIETHSLGKIGLEGRDEIRKMNLPAKGMNLVLFTLEQPSMVNFWVDTGNSTVTDGGVFAMTPNLSLSLSSDKLPKPYQSMKGGSAGESISAVLPAGFYTVNLADSTKYDEKGLPISEHHNLRFTESVSLNVKIQPYDTRQIEGRMSIPERDSTMPIRMRVAEFNNGERLEFTKVSNLDPSKPVWGIIHGKDSSDEADIMKQVTNSLYNLAVIKNFQVVTIDWSEAAKDGIFIQDAPWAVGGGQWLARQLIATGFKPEDIHLIGWSHGSYFSFETGKEIERMTGEKINAIVALDAANNIPLLSGYDHSPVNFANASRDSLGIDSSIVAGSDSLAGTALRAFKLLMPNSINIDTFTKHKLAVAAFAKILDKEKSSPGPFSIHFSLDSLMGKTPDSLYAANKYDTVFEGIINVNLDGVQPLLEQLIYRDSNNIERSVSFRTINA